MSNVNEKSNKVVIDLGNKETEEWVASNTLELEFYLTDEENVYHVNLDFLKNYDGISFGEVMGNRKLAFRTNYNSKLIEDKRFKME